MTDVEFPRQRIRHQRMQAPRRRALYWAYGSNLSVDQMTRRCPAASPEGGLYMKHGSLLFRGVADVTVRAGSLVPGGLWRITRNCERSLDQYEGVASRMYVKRYFTVIIGGEKEDVLFYQMATHRGVMPPTDEYIQVIADGYEDFGLDRQYLDAALREAWSDKDVTPALRRRHEGRGRPILARSLPLPTEYITASPSFHLSEDDLREAGAL